MQYIKLFLCRYEYDDHYFLTDPKEFIYEFFPLQPEWQLLKEPITLEEFEELPFVRSLFFRYQLAFPTEHMKSVMTTDQTGKIIFSHNFIMNGLKIISLMEHNFWLVWEHFRGNFLRETVSGACTVRLEMPLDMQSALIFHYNLKFYNNDTDNYDGVSLKRFVMQVQHLLQS